jgi:hypothetical protein
MSNLILNWFRFGFALSSLALLAGCGQRELPKATAYPTRGKVLWHGEPVCYAVIDLAPATGSGGAEADGSTGEDGTFTLRTFSNEGEPDGAVPGEYVVNLKPWDPVRFGPLPKGAKPTQIPGEFNTGVTIEVKAEDNDLIVEIP